MAHEKTKQTLYKLAINLGLNNVIMLNILSIILHVFNSICQMSFDRKAMGLWVFSCFAFSNLYCEFEWVELNTPSNTLQNSCPFLPRNKECGRIAKMNNRPLVLWNTVELGYNELSGTNRICSWSNNQTNFKSILFGHMAVTSDQESPKKVVWVGDYENTRTDHENPLYSIRGRSQPR